MPVANRTKVINNKKRHLSGWKKDIPDHRDSRYQISFVRSLFLPAKVDLRPNCTPVEDQMDIGSCTAASSTSAVEFLYKKQGKKPPQLSRLFLYYASRVWIEGGPPAEDSGAQIRDVMRALAKYGTCFEDTWPYEPAKFSFAPSPMSKIEAERHQILSFYQCPTLRYIKACLASGYPCVGGFSVPTSMESDETTATGIVRFPDPTEEFIGGHAVLFVGYDDKRSLLMFQNSWGTGWGDKGFGYLPYKFVTDKLADDFWTIRNVEM